MIQLPFSKARWDNTARYGIAGIRNDREFEACLLCGRPVYLDTNPKYIRMDVDGNAITDAEGEADPRYDQGAFVIGPDCLRKHPELKEYTR